jgi:transposase
MPRKRSSRKINQSQAAVPTPKAAAKPRAAKPRASKPKAARQNAKRQANDDTSPKSGSQRRQARKAEEKAERKKARKKTLDRAEKRSEDLKAQQQAEIDKQQAEAEPKMAQMPIIHEHAAGVDVGDRSHWVAVDKTPDGSTDSKDTVREFPSHTPGLRRLVDWLRQCGVTTVALEATGAYGNALYMKLVEEGFDAIITPPQFARQIRGRPKTDRLDCQWIQRLHKLGMLPSVFQPSEESQTLRHYVRVRANLVRVSSHHIQRMQKSLQLMNLKLTNVLGDITGVTGQRIIRAIARGVRDPKKLSELRDRRCQHSEEEIAIALDGCYRPEHVLELQVSLALWDEYQSQIALVDRAIEEHLRKMTPKMNEALPPLPAKKTKSSKSKPHAAKFDVRKALYYMVGIDLTEIEGIDGMNALVLVSELGTDFSKWPTVKHFASWLGLCPNWQKTGGKVKSSKTRRGKNRAAQALRMGAFSLMRSDSYLGAYLRGQRSRLGAPKAITATAHKMARILYNMMRYGIAYAKKTESDYQEQQRNRLERNLHRRAKELGYRMEKIAGSEPVEASNEPMVVAS